MTRADNEVRRVHCLDVRVYYEDTDFSGAVYHANYLKFCERGRSDMLRGAGINHTALAREGLHFVVRRMVCEFHAAARIDDLLRVETRVSAARGARVEMKQRVVRDEKALFEAKVTVALVGREGRPRRISPGLSARLVQN